MSFVPDKLSPSIARGTPEVPWRLIVIIPSFAPSMGVWSFCTGSTVMLCFPGGQALRSIGKESLPGMATMPSIDIMPPIIIIGKMSMSTMTW